MTRYWLIWLLAFAGPITRAGAIPLQPLELKVDGVVRSALVYAPASARTNPTPLVFVFHGHGGGARQVAESFAMEKQWPEAMVVYPQGLDTPGQLTDPGGNLPGWEGLMDDQGDRDLKF